MTKERCIHVLKALLARERKWVDDPEDEERLEAVEALSQAVVYLSAEPQGKEP